MIPIVNNMLIWEKELEIQEQRRKQRRIPPEVFENDAPVAQPKPRKSFLRWLPRLQWPRQQPSPCECAPEPGC